MPISLDASTPGFPDAFARLVEGRREEASDVSATVAAILAEVRARGDDAVIEYSRALDRVELTAATMRVGEAEFAAALDGCPGGLRAALELAAARIRSFHQLQLPEPVDEVEPLGVRRGVRWRPIEAVGLYVPGGTAAYPSSLLMNAIPAKVAGCARVVMTVPAPDGRLSPTVLAAAALAGVDEVWRIGGAQAIGALAFGTASIRPVDKIVGPGNAYVAEAKRQVFGRVGIDMLAGPSEVVIVAEAVCPPAWIAADLLSQAEHDASAQAVLITADADLAAAVEAEVEAQLVRLERRAIAAASWRDQGAIIRVGSLDQAARLVDALAPEHLQLIGPAAEALLPEIRNAGSIFLGPHTPEVIGDYVGGPNHVLPTGRSARFASGLSVHDFLKRTTYLSCDEGGFRALGGAAATLARAEGLEAHARAVELRLQAR